ncbi:aldehyde dehydrogenase [Marinicella litoralis]|uniref:Aminomuconate-semialdehyde/2-hydroxymuconate-6-semialdehyde dehydrogenase n=1 Tax=Marinicella litoralis TaxID=644220 RepID=A0A4V6PXZ9_9GAMM|nr:aldehyde dehydrogenase [Marinicella litoralis]TDR23621.1 aminomuconate-semialdehyde/2-hydroxymuconate-6-semialdehyde dehydrogenase [Marinicella litoralis]
MSLKKIQNYINGVLTDPIDGHYLDNHEPATGLVYALTPESNEQDLKLAVDAAEQAFPAWSNTPAEHKAKVLNRLADLIEVHQNDLAKAEAIDNGKPITLAKNVDIYRAAANIRFFAQACTQYSSESHSMENVAINYTLRDPLGVVACISPWNLPLYLFTWKIAPALATGNTVVAKPSEITPMSAYLFAKLCIEAGLPAGVLNIIHGTGQSIGAPLTIHPKIKAISFTGGSNTGTSIKQATANQHKKLSLELGGKNPTLVFADCDFERTVKEVARAAFANQGQICLCGSRIYIERSIYQRFTQALVAEVNQLTIGDPLLAETQFGALVSQPHMEKVLGYIELAQQEGGQLLTGGSQLEMQGRCAGGYFVQPTIVAGLSNSCRTNQEEIFGPVCTVQAFDTDDQAVSMANDSAYGLACSIWSQDISRCHRLAKKVNCGIVWVNCWLLRDLRTPFGGMKASGSGREGGLEAMRFFTEPKNVCIQFNP